MAEQIYSGFCLIYFDFDIFKSKIQHNVEQCNVDFNYVEKAV